MQLFAELAMIPRYSLNLYGVLKPAKPHELGDPVQGRLTREVDRTAMYILSRMLHLLQARASLPRPTAAVAIIAL